MIIGITKEGSAGETRVAASALTVKSLLDSVFTEVLIEKEAGLKSSISDEDYRMAGATILKSQSEVYKKANIILKVRRPSDEEVDLLSAKHIVIGMLQPHDKKFLSKLADSQATGLALELIPRISRAQSMDVLSSQANLAGYKSVLIAANHYSKVMPMLMTAAGTVKAARCIVMGVGVAGLQAIATAKRLGCIVEATDVRQETKEQVESLGAKFIEVPHQETNDEQKTESVYAKEMSEDYKARQKELISSRVRDADIVITTALIPGKPAPILLTEDMVSQMKAGSVIVDLAAEQGGNCPLTTVDKVTEYKGVTLIGHSNIPSMVASDASLLYSRNILNFVKNMIDDQDKFVLNTDDEIISSTLVCKDGECF